MCELHARATNNGVREALPKPCFLYSFLLVAMIRIDAPDAIAPYLRDASNLGTGTASAVVIPQTLEELRAFVRLCAQTRQPYTVAGQRTGLAGGTVPDGGIVLSTERLAAVQWLDASRQRIAVEPGVLLQDVQQLAQEAGLLYPPDPTERLCSIGGSIATNASGARTFLYGPTRRYVEALHVLLPDGEELQLRRGEVFAKGGELSMQAVSGKTYQLQLPALAMPAIKHAAGYYIQPNMDAIDLFIGSEGTLGVVAAAELALLPAPENILSAMAWFDSEDQMLSFVEEVRALSLVTRSGAAVGVNARALEVFDKRALSFIADLLPAMPDATVAALWFEQEITSDTEDAMMAAWYELICRYSSLANQTIMAVNERDREQLRAWRHAVSARVYERLSATGQTKIGTDMAVPDSLLRSLYALYHGEFAATGLEYILYGHIGNNHLHANIFVHGENERQRAWTAYNNCMRHVLAWGGTISAEHGVGKIKREYLVRMYGEAGVQGFRRVKKEFDPRGLLGRNTMFSTE